MSHMCGLLFQASLFLCDVVTAIDRNAGLHCVCVLLMEPPHPDIVHAYIDQLKRNSEYKTDKDIVRWLGMKGSHAERRLRSYRSGKNQPTYSMWRKVLVATGRVPQEIEPVIGFMRGKPVERYK